MVKKNLGKWALLFVFVGLGFGSSANAEASERGTSFKLKEALSLNSVQSGDPASTAGWMLGFGSYAYLWDHFYGGVDLNLGDVRPTYGIIGGGLTLGFDVPLITNFLSFNASGTAGIVTRMVDFLADDSEPISSSFFNPTAALEFSLGKGLRLAAIGGRIFAPRIPSMASNYFGLRLSFAWTTEVKTVD